MARGSGPGQGIGIIDIVAMAFHGYMEVLGGETQLFLLKPASGPVLAAPLGSDLKTGNSRLGQLSDPALVMRPAGAGDRSRNAREVSALDSRDHTVRPCTGQGSARTSPTSDGAWAVTLAPTARLPGSHRAWQGAPRPIRPRAGGIGISQALPSG